MNYKPDPLASRRDQAIDKALGIKRRKRNKSMKIRRKVMPMSHPIRSYEAMDDTHVYKQGVRRDEVVLGVYGTEEWIVSDFARDQYLAGSRCVQIDNIYIVPAGFNLAEWVMSITDDQFNFFSSNRVLIRSTNADGKPDCLIKVTSGRGKMEVELLGEVSKVKQWDGKISAMFKKAQNLIQWVYSQRGDEISVPLNYRPPVEGAYPFLDKPIMDYIDDYLNSSASILILQGPPGVGKTSLIKALIHRSAANAKVAYDEKVMADDNLFAMWIEDDSRFMVLEDADAFLKTREDGNTMMHKFLNVSDGLISAADKKLVFSTNLDNIKDIDSALMRPGRCYDVVEARALTAKEAQNVCDLNPDARMRSDKSSYTLAELFSEIGSSEKKKDRRIGFL
jgi:hypothetical protein